MKNSKQIAGFIGPIITAIVISEMEFVQPHLYDAQIPPVVYLSGVLFFIAGFSIIRAHNYWARSWPVLITIMGWLALFLGLFRMFFAGTYQRGAQNASTPFLIIELLGVAVGIFLTYKAYWTPKNKIA